jgi:magnesium and cobalt transporter
MNDKSEGGEPQTKKPVDYTSIGNAIWHWLRGLWRAKNGDSTARETLEVLIEERVEAELPFDQDELALLANIFELRGRTVQDVMVPRVDIVAIERNTSFAGVVEAIMREGHSRLPVFNETLDNSFGMVHIKDVIAWRGRDDKFKLNDIVHQLLFVAPSMQVLELLLEMRVKRCHMALVVDEYGGIDGLVTIEDLVEEIVGEIEDEHDAEDKPEFRWRADGSLDADARASIESFEEMFGRVATVEEHEEIKSLGGLVFSLVGRVPIRGEIITHPAGVEFEVLDADPRRVKRLRICRSRPATVAKPQA